MALGKHAYQSSTAWDGDASRAVDGNTDSDYFGGNSCTHTEGKEGQWWEVDLGAEAEISHVSLDSVYQSSLKK